MGWAGEIFETMRAIHTIYFHFHYNLNLQPPFPFLPLILNHFINGLWNTTVVSRLIWVLSLLSSLFSYICPLFSIFKTVYNLRICPKWSLHRLMDWSSQKFHNIGLSIQCVNSTTASGNQYLSICVDNPNSQSLTCMLAKPLHLYHSNFNYLSTCWTSLCWPNSEMFGKMNKNEKKKKWWWWWWWWLWWPGKDDLQRIEVHPRLENTFPPHNTWTFSMWTSIFKHVGKLTRH